MAGNESGTATPLAPRPTTPLTRPIMQTPQPQIAASQSPVTQQRRTALLLPLSGAQAAVGTSLRNAALLAVQDLAPPAFEMKVYDTAKGANAAFADARADGAELIIGPLFSADVQAIRSQAAAAGLPVLALSNDISLAGQGIYVTGFWPGAQVARVVNYAARHGSNRMAVLVPDDAYGERVLAALQQSQLRQIVPIRYAAGTAPAAIVTQLAGLRGQYDTLLLAEGGQRTLQIVEALQGADLLLQPNGRPVQLLGSGLWDTPELAGQPLLQGAWYAAPDPGARTTFESRYQQIFGEAPQRIASLAYDATALAAVLAARGWPYAPQALAQTQGFDGVDGLFRLRPEGVAERGLAILQFGPNGPRLLDPAPKQFR